METFLSLSDIYFFMNFSNSNLALSKLADMASAAKAEGSHIWMQINHAGRQTQKMINKHVVCHYYYVKMVKLDEFNAKIHSLGNFTV